ncbi:hypothetical protein GGP68_001633 [Salinibacter ruber]|uniref:Uncharacterized protein n=1 Tax=Salinibacter ruber TaxID=146919 RepID=A0A9X2THG9_9BACT|nr:hypothetical protein [Salinibacter ruber]MCS3682792.1 hypothetical protein [Salinibacter ruber]MCS3710231.1 hypothetical protein [Salinibacter ruber]
MLSLRAYQPHESEMPDRRKRAKLESDQRTILPERLVIRTLSALRDPILPK